MPSASATLGVGAGATRRVDPALLKSILAERDFHGADPVSRAFVRFVEMIQRWLAGFSLVPGGSAAGGMWLRIVLVAAGAIIAGIAAAWLWRALVRRGPSGRPGPDAARGVAARGDGLPGEDIETTIGRLVAAGDLDVAMRVLFATIPPALVDAQILPARREFTNRQMVRAASTARPAIGGLLASMVDVFERCFYGQRRIALGEWESFRQGWAAVTHALEAAARRPGSA